MNFEEEERKREKRNQIMRGILICFVLTISILVMTGVISFETLNVPEPTEPKLQLRWDELP